jgi:hypothetical protein
MRRSLLLLVAVLLVPSSTSAESELRVPLRTQAIVGSIELGTVDVPGAGELRFEAQRDDAVVVVTGTGPDEAVVGRAETVVGLEETPIFVRTPGGTEKITIRWGAEGDE